MSIEPATLWLIAAAILILMEFILPGGIVFFLGLAAAVVSGLLYLGLIDGWLSAFTVWFIGCLALVFGLRGVVQKLVPALVEKTNTDEDLDAYGQIAEVCTPIPINGEGRIHFRDTTWPARNAHADRELPVGTSVRIVFRDNLVWIVEATEE